VRAKIVGKTLSMIIEQGEDGQAHLVWLGPMAQEEMAVPARFQRLPASPDQPVGPVLMPEHGRGFHGIPQIEALQTASRRRVHLQPPTLEVADNTACLTALDPVTGLRVEGRFRFSGDQLISQVRISNEGDGEIDVQRIASCLIPAPDWASEVLTHAGAWGREGMINRRGWRSGRIEQTGRGGRPGFDGGPTLTLCEADTTETTGRALTLHLGWSGPFRLAVERATDGAGQVLAEQLLFPGEIRLKPGGQADLPEALIAYSDAGFGGVSEIFHAGFRKRSRPVIRKVHFNTWEARYFDVNEAGCIALAEKAAELGAERFILDDGWFTGRRNDQTSLGDWTVDAGQFPNGLAPVIDAAHRQNMTFGLWLEPEMVSQDSALYRAHPDWALGYPDCDLATGRNQLVLDLGLPDVRNYLFDSISELLTEYPIDYLKWDCNRDLYPATREGIARPALQTEALYLLLGKVSAAHPEVEIESCASGGGRIDAGIARHVTRFWTSDATDAVDRIRIQRAASLIVPPEMLGAHVGPSPNPMTGRHIPMTFRVLTAFFGHFGIEADPAHLTDQDAAILRRGIEIYKANRDWMGSARLCRLCPDGQEPDVQLMISNSGDRGLIRILRVDTPARPLQTRYRLSGLDPAARYQLTELVLAGEPVRWPIGNFSGDGLMKTGLALDPGKAQSGRLIDIERLDG